MAAITVDIPHQLGRAEARTRIETGFGKFTDLLPGGAGSKCSKRWEGDRLIFNLATMGQKIPGVITVDDLAVTIEIELPGMFGLIGGGLKNRLQKVGQLLLTKK